MHVHLVRMMNVSMACDQYDSATVYQGLVVSGLLFDHDHCLAVLRC